MKKVFFGVSASIVAILLAQSSMALDSATVPPCTDYVATVEVNTFGDQPRTVVIYRDEAGNIIDWRWLSDPIQIPKPVGTGLYRYMAVWNDQGVPRTVYTISVRFTRTLEDRELAERTTYPESKRRKLSSCTAPTPSPAPAPAPGAAPVPPPG